MTRIYRLAVLDGMPLCKSVDLPRGSEKLRNRLTISHSKLIDFAIKLLSKYCILLSDQYRPILEVFQARQMSVCHIRSRAFGSTGVERERIRAYRKRVWIDRRRARMRFSTPETHLDRQASSEGVFQHSRNAFGSTGVERERI